MLKTLGKGEEIISCDVIYQFHCNMSFYSSEGYQEFIIVNKR